MKINKGSIIKILCVSLSSLFLVAGCQNENNTQKRLDEGGKVSDTDGKEADERNRSDDNGADKNDNDNKERLKGDLTFEDAVYTSGFISSGSGLRDGHEIFWSDGRPMELSEYGITENVKWIKSETSGGDDSRYVVITESGDGYDVHKYGNGCQRVRRNETESEKIREVVFLPRRASGEDEVYVLSENGTLWFEEESDEIIREDVSMIRAKSRNILITYNNGTVELWNPDENIPDMIQSQVSDWSNIKMAVGGIYDTELYAVGLKADGTVIATENISDQLTDWKNIIYIVSSDACFAGLTSNGKVLVVYVNPAFEGKLDYVENWENIIALDVQYKAYLSALDINGHIMRDAYGNVSEEDGFGPEEYLK